MLPHPVLILNVRKYGRKTHLSVSVHSVGHPATRFHLVGVQAPELEFLLKQGPAHVGGVVQLAGPGGRK